MRNTCEHWPRIAFTTGWVKMTRETSRLRWFRVRFSWNYKSQCVGERDVPVVEYNVHKFQGFDETELRMKNFSNVFHLEHGKVHINSIHRIMNFSESLCLIILKLRIWRFLWIFRPEFSSTYFPVFFLKGLFQAWKQTSFYEKISVRRFWNF